MLRDQDVTHQKADANAPVHAESATQHDAKTSFSTHGDKPEVARGSGEFATRSASDQAFGKGEQAKGGMPEAEKQELRHDVLFERVAHMAYGDSISPEDADYLAQHGLRFSHIVHGKGGLDMMTFVPTEGSHEHAVLAFRGTRGATDVAEDANPAGVGAYQMAANEGLIAQTLATLHAPTVVGHSLGGALAQMTASRFPDMVSRVVTFQSPGIPSNMVARLDRHNAEAHAAGKDEVTSHHYGVKGDLVPTAGAAFTSGFRTIIERNGKLQFVKDLASDHTSKPLEEYEAKGEPAGMAHDVDANHRSFGGGIFHTFADAVRAGVGRAIEAKQSLEGNTTDVAYVHVWEQVRAAIDSNAKPQTIIAIIEASHVDADAKHAMIDNLREIEAATAQR